MRRIKLLSILALMLFCALGAEAEIYTVTWTDFSGEGDIYNYGELVSYSGDRNGGDLYDGTFYVNRSNKGYYIEKIEITCTSTDALTGDITGSAPTLIWEGHKEYVKFDGKINGVSKIVITIDGPVEVKDIEFSESGINMSLGEKRWLLVTVYPENATDKNVTFESRNPEVAVVSDKGLVEAVGNGTAIIVATCGDVMEQCHVIVNTYYHLVFKEGTKDAKKWYVSPNPSRAGEPITMKYYGKKKVKSVKAVKKIIDVTEVTLNKSSIELLPGKSELLKASILPEYASDKNNVTWTSSNPDVATVEYGLVKAVKRGDALITATVGGKSATCEVTVPTTLADALEDGALVSIIVNFSSEPNGCHFSNADGTFNKISDYGNHTENFKKELKIENGNLVFRVCPGDFDSPAWEDWGYQITFNPTTNTYKEWIGAIIFGDRPSFESIAVDNHTIDLTKE